MKKLRVVHVGCGGMSAAWLGPATQEFQKQLEVVGLVDLDESAARKCKEEFGLTRAHTGSNLDAMLRELKPDIVFDCTLPKAHKRVTLTALKHGCHVIGEKPMAENMRDARQMVAAARAANRLYAVTTQRRYMRQIRAVRQLVESGRLGKLTTLNSDFYIGAHFGGFRDHMPHVLLVDMAIHTFDMARFISGADPLAVYCKEWNPSGSWYDRDASAMAIFEMSDGLVYTYRGSWCTEGMATSWEASWMLVGEKGFATWDGGDRLRAQMLKKRGGFISEMKSVDIPIRASNKPSGHAAVIADFINCIRKGGTPQTICTDNIKSLAMVMAAVKSAETGRRVSV
jgi:predicted dehydrogenase